MVTGCNNKTFDELYRKVDIVARIRYDTARRLKTHQQLSQWVISFLSFLLILVPLSQALDIPLKHSENFFNAVGVSLAILVLVYSLLIGIENYGGRSDKMQNCGTELSYLAREIYPYRGVPHEAEVYKSFSRQYQTILEKYENHDLIDYKQFTLGKNWKQHYKNFPHYALAWLTINLQYYLGFWHYVLVTLSTILMIVYLYLPTRF
jgi:hypothetical protein